MKKKLFASVLVSLCLATSAAWAALPKEGVYEKYTSNGTLEARMYVMERQGSSKYSFEYGNSNAQVIWVESFAANGEKQAEFATKYIWKTDSAGAAETALLFDKEGLDALQAGKVATPVYAKDMGAFSFDDNGMAKVHVGNGFVGEPESWLNANVAASLNGDFSYVAEDLTFTPLSLAYTYESLTQPDRFLNAEKVNSAYNLAKLRLRRAGERYEYVENMLEQGYLVKLAASLGFNVMRQSYTGGGVLTGSEVRMRANTTTNARIVGMLDLDEAVTVEGYEKGLDERGWYYVTKANGQKGFAAAQFIALQ